MDKFHKLKIGHLILSPHPHDEDKFRAQVPWIINWITEKKSISFYSISEELGDNNHYIDYMLSLRHYLTVKFRHKQKHSQ